jgi:hypothetical protein
MLRRMQRGFELVGVEPVPIHLSGKVTVVGRLVRAAIHPVGLVRGSGHQARVPGGPAA